MIRRANNRTIVASYIAAGLLIACLVLSGLDANAVDGNYSSPYGSQFDMRTTSATLSNEALVGSLLVTLNFLAAVFYSLRKRSQKHS